MTVNIILVIMSSKKPEELTLEEIREQQSLYQRLFYQKMKNSPEFQEARKQSKRKHYYKKKAEREEQKKLQESSDEPPKARHDNRKYKKDLNDAFIIVWCFETCMATICHIFFFAKKMKTLRFTSVLLETLTHQNVAKFGS